ncbi:MAG: hypothetical protein KGJ84_10470 [Elusimicrobia bacterium]|nr:hypothetical protein [Elusimicrobiota bacterium]
MDVALAGWGAKDPETILAWIMFTGVALAAGLVVFLLVRHGHRGRKARKAHPPRRHPPA